MNHTKITARLFAECADGYRIIKISKNRAVVTVSRSCENDPGARFQSRGRQYRWHEETQAYRRKAHKQLDLWSCLLQPAPTCSSPVQPEATPVQPETLRATAIKSWADIGHAEREQIADDLNQDTWRRVTVERFGTGNAQHSGVLPWCGVSYIAASR